MDSTKSDKTVPVAQDKQPEPVNKQAIKALMQSIEIIY
jgi:hypothetical protein